MQALKILIHQLQKVLSVSFKLNSNNHLINGFTETSYGTQLRQNCIHTYAGFDLLGSQYGLVNCFYDYKICWPKFYHFPVQAEEQLKIVEEQRKIHEERMKLEQERQRQQKEEQKIILGKGKSRPKLSFSLKSQD